jgi:hypothetical protein
MDLVVEIKEEENNSGIKSNHQSSDTVRESGEETTDRQKHDTSEFTVRHTMDFSMEDNEVEKIKNDITSVVKQLSKYYNYSNHYTTDLIHIFKKLSEIIFKKLTNTLNQNKNIIQFFKEVTLTYQKFSTNLIKANSMITSSSIQDQIFSETINNAIEKTQESIANNFSNFSTILQNEIISKGPFTRIKEIYTRLSTVTKESQTGIYHLERRKEKLNKLYTKKYLQNFDAIISNENLEDSNVVLSEILRKNDFYLIDLELEYYFNKLFEKTVKFLASYKELLLKIKQLTLDYLNVVKETIEIYINENKKIFSHSSEDSSLKLDTIQTFYDSINMKTLDT